MSTAPIDFAAGGPETAEVEGEPRTVGNGLEVDALAVAFSCHSMNHRIWAMAAAFAAITSIEAAETSGPHAIAPLPHSSIWHRAYPEHGSIERLSPELDALLAPSARMERLAEGFVWSEGPVWIPRQHALLFSDVPANRVYRWSERGGLSVYLEPSGYTGTQFQFREPGSNGLTTNAKGELILCQHGNRQIARLTHRNGVEGTFEPVAAYYNGRRFNSPNDLCFARNGNLYFTDPPYGLAGLNDSPLKELIFNGVFLVRPEGDVVALTTALAFPNGIALSPDQKTLYVGQSDSRAPILMAYPLAADGTLGEGKVFFDASALAKSGRSGSPDGMKVDARGNVWTSGPGGILVISPAGKHLGTLLTGTATANCNWGGDGTTLYITANHDLLRIKTLVHGAGTE